MERRTELIWPFMPHVKQTLLIGQERVECSFRTPHVKHFELIETRYPW